MRHKVEIERDNPNNNDHIVGKAYNFFNRSSIKETL